MGDLLLERYGRQMLLQGRSTQERLAGLRVLVVGAGALGCACLPYLVGAGVGCVTICDGDIVETSNLHRQPLHDEAGAKAKANKAESAAARLRALNSSVTVVAEARHVAFDAWTFETVRAHDVVCDCSDNVGTRYLLNDACFLASSSKTVLVSAAALGGEGSITTYDFEARRGCYRCAYPKPSAFEARRSCADRGVLGPVPGVLGSLQALAVLRRCERSGVSKSNGGLDSSSDSSSSDTSSSSSDSSSTRVFDGRDVRSFQRAPKRPTCALCGDAPSILSMEDSKRACRAVGLFVDLPEDDGCSSCASFGSLRPPPLAALPEDACASCAELRAAMDSNEPVALLDVRDRNQFSMCRLDGAVNVPLRELLVDGPQKSKDRLQRELDLPASGGLTTQQQQKKTLFVLCRRGVDSRVATAFLRDAVDGVIVKNVDGGLLRWRADVDATFPTY